MFSWRTKFTLDPADEQVLITLQAGRGVASHRNTVTGFDGAVFSAMGVLVAVVWTATRVLALSATRSSASLPAGRATASDARPRAGLNLVGASS